MALNISKITINAPIQKVWDTLTQPELVKIWQFGSDLFTNWEVGSEIRFSTAWENQVFEQCGKVLEIKALEMISYSLFAPRPGLEDKPENYFTMTYLLKEQNGQTELQIVQEDNRPGAKQEAEQGEENPILKGLKNTAES